MERATANDIRATADSIFSVAHFGKRGCEIIEKEKKKQQEQQQNFLCTHSTAFKTEKKSLKTSYMKL